MFAFYCTVTFFVVLIIFVMLTIHCSLSILTFLEILVCLEINCTNYFSLVICSWVTVSPSISFTEIIQTYRHIWHIAGIWFLYCALISAIYALHISSFILGSLAILNSWFQSGLTAFVLDTTSLFSYARSSWEQTLSKFYLKSLKFVVSLDLEDVWGFYVRSPHALYVRIPVFFFFLRLLH